MCAGDGEGEEIEITGKEQPLMGTYPTSMYNETWRKVRLEPFFIWKKNSLGATQLICRKRKGDVLGLVVQLLLPTSRSALRRAHVAPGQRRDGFLRAIFTVYNHKTNSPKMPQTK